MNNFPKYEYIMRCFDGLTSAAICEEMNKLGQEGWKLVSSPNNIICQGINTNLDMFIFMRDYYELNIVTD